MEDIVAVAIELTNGQKRYFLTWGRIQDAVENAPLEAIVLEYASKFDLGGAPSRACVCHTLQEAAQQPYFYEHFYTMGQKGIPYGRRYLAWKKKIDKLMRRGKELYYLGKPNSSATFDVRR